MTKEQRQLVNYAAHVLKALHAKETIELSNVVVKYNFDDVEARIMWPPNVVRTKNGHEQYYKWELIDALKEVSDLYGIGYAIIMSVNFELHIKIYV